MPQRDLRGHIRQVHARGLGKEGHSARGARVHLDHVHPVVFIDDELNVVRPADADAQPQAHGVIQNGFPRVRAQREGRVHADGIARVHARALHVLHDAGDVHVFPIAHRVHFQFFAADVAIDQHGLILADQHGRLQIVPQRELVIHDLHGAAAQHIGRAHQHRIADARGGGDAILDLRHRTTLRLGDIQAAHGLFEAVAVLRALDGLHVRADDGHAQLRKPARQIDGGLPAQRHDDPIGALHIDDVHHVFHGERLEIELIADRVIRGNGFGVVVDDDGLVPRLADGPDGVHSGIIEFHALPNADGARAQHHHRGLVRHHGLVLFLVGGVEIRNVGIELAGAGVDHFVHGQDAVGAAQGVHFRFAHAPPLADVAVRKAHALGPAQRGQIARMGLHFLLKGDDRLDLRDEEEIDAGDVANHDGIHAAAQQFADGVQPLVRGVFDFLKERLVRIGIELFQPDVRHPGFQGAHGLEQALLHGAANGHHLARGLHLRGQFARSLIEFVKGEARDLAHHVVQRRLEAGGRVGDGDLVQRKAHGDERAHARDGIAAGLAGQGGRARNARVDLDHIVVHGKRVERELHVAAAFNLQRANEAQRRVAQHVVFPVGERLRGANHDGIPGMHAHGIHVFHVADGQRGVVAVAHHFIFDFFITADGFLHQHLIDRRKAQRVFRAQEQFFLIVRETAARAAQRERGAQHHREADPAGDGQRLFHRARHVGGNDRLADFQAQFLEFFAVFRLFNAIEARAQDFTLALLQNALFVQLHGQVQPRLPAQRGQERVRPLLADDLGRVFQRERLHIHLVRDVGVRHDGGGVGIEQDHRVPLFLERHAGLRARIIEFRRLADDDGAGTDDQDFLNVRALRHACVPPPWWR